MTLYRAPEADLPVEVELEHVQCPLGCQAADKTVLTGWDRINHLPGRFTVVRCEGCGLMRTNPRPTLATMQYYYPATYGPYLATRVVQSPPAAVSPRWRRAIRARVDFRTMTLPTLPPGRLLEVGCASGSFLNDMRDRGWKVRGIEPSSTAGEAARSAGLDVHVGPIEGAPDPPNQMDLLVAWMAVEHLHDPIGALRRMRTWASTEGWLVLSVPNTTPFTLRIYGDRWYGLHLPTHLHHFDRITIAHLLCAAGWRTDHIFDQRVLSDHMASVGYALQEQAATHRLGDWFEGFPVRSGRHQFIAYPLASALAAAGRSGRLTIWARPC